MTNVIKEKSIRCIEWSMKLPSYNDTLISELFIVQDRKCYLEASNSAVYFRSNGKMIPPVHVSVQLLSCNRNLAPETRLVDNDNQIIWNFSTVCFPEDDLFILEVIFHALPSKDAETVKQSQETLDTKANDHFQALSRDFSMLLKDNSSCDVEVTCEDKKFKAHRLVLGARSPVLSPMLKTTKTKTGLLKVDDKSGLIKIEDVKASIFESFLSYLYSGTLPTLKVDTAKQFYEVGDKYGVKELKTACSEFLTKNLSVANACEMLILANQHNDSTFENDVICYIVDKKVPQRDSEWSKFCESYPSLAIKVQNLFIQKHCSN